MAASPRPAGRCLTNHRRSANHLRSAAAVANCSLHGFAVHRRPESGAPSSDRLDCWASLTQSSDHAHSGARHRRAPAGRWVRPTRLDRLQRPPSRLQRRPSPMRSAESRHWRGWRARSPARRHGFSRRRLHHVSRFASPLLPGFLSCLCQPCASPAACATCRRSARRGPRCRCTPVPAAALALHRLRLPAAPTAADTEPPEEFIDPISQGQSGCRWGPGEQFFFGFGAAGRRRRGGAPAPLSGQTQRGDARRLLLAQAGWAHPG